jgi:hypothetical protein
MLAIIRNRIRFRTAGLAFLGTLALGLSSCATHKETALISDPNDKKETALPWNEQQKWEREGEASAMNQQRR